MEQVVECPFEHGRRTNILWQRQLAASCGTTVDLDSNAWIDSIGAWIDFEWIKFLLKLSLFSLELRTHVLTCTDELDRERKIRWFVRVRQDA